MRRAFQNLLNFQRTQEPVGHQLPACDMTDSEQSPGLVSKNSHGRGIRPGAPATQAREKPTSIFTVERDTYMASQQRLGRLQAGQACVFVHGFKLRQGDTAFHPDATRIDTTQESEMCTTTERRADIFAQRADVGAFAAGHYYFNSWLRLTVVRQSQIQCMNDDIARRTLDGDARARILVQCLAVLFERAVHRRYLAYRTGELLLHLRQAFGSELCRIDRPTLEHLAFGVTRGRGGAQQGNGLVSLGRLQL